MLQQVVLLLFYETSLSCNELHVGQTENTSGPLRFFLQMLVCFVMLIKNKTAPRLTIWIFTENMFFPKVIFLLLEIIFFILKGRGWLRNDNNDQ